MTPCRTDPDMWWGYQDATAAPGAPHIDRHAQRQAQLLCLRDCPAGAQRTCARTALSCNATHGVWAGIRLPGQQVKHRRVRLECQRDLRRIADGDVRPHELPANRALLRMMEGQ
jgi:WhiB family redox-sensing transcriptional regulator